MDSLSIILHWEARWSWWNAVETVGSALTEVQIPEMLAARQGRAAPVSLVETAAGELEWEADSGATLRSGK